MQTVANNNTITSFKVENKEFVVIPKKEYMRLKRDYSQIENEGYPKMYMNTDSEGTWETLDFGPDGIDPKELLLIHKELKNG